MLPDYITKIEGHGVLNIHFKECKARLEVSEGERLFEAILRGQVATRAPFITSRICGVCPTAHNLASIYAVENGLRLEVSNLDKKLRDLMLSGQVIFSHLLHLFFLVLPDYQGVSSVLEMADKYPVEFHNALKLKAFSDKLLKIIGGRPIHPTSTTVGGFLKYPTKESLSELRKDFDAAIEGAQSFVEIVSKIKVPSVERKAEYLALFDDGMVQSTSGLKFSPQEYKKQIKERVSDYSTAKFGYLANNGGFIVGSLARVSMLESNLNPKAKASYSLMPGFPFSAAKHNPFNNIYAQAVEFMNCLEEGAKILDEILTSEIPATPPKVQLEYPIEPKWGIAAVEAPRGTLYHAYEIASDGKIINADIVTPTVQNLTSLEEDAEHLLKTMELHKQEQNVCIRELEMLIRAYDPCITCSVH